MELGLSTLTAQGCVSVAVFTGSHAPASLLGCITGPHLEAPLHPGMHIFRGRGARRGGPDGSSPRSLGHGGRAPITLMSGWARGDQTVGRRTSASLSLAAVGFFPPVAASAWVRGLVRVCLLSHPPRVEEWELGKARCAFSLGGGRWLRVPWGIPHKGRLLSGSVPEAGLVPSSWVQASGWKPSRYLCE